MRSHEGHIKRARERLNSVHEAVDALEVRLHELRGLVVSAENQLKTATEQYVQAKTAEAIAKLEEK